MLLSNWTKNKKNRYFEAANGGEWQRPVKRKILPKMKLHYEYYSPQWRLWMSNWTENNILWTENGRDFEAENVAAYFALILFCFYFYHLFIGLIHCNVAACFSFVYFFFFSCSSIFLCGEVFQKIFLFRISNTTVAKNKENWRVTIFKLREDFNHGIAMHCNGKQISWKNWGKKKIEEKTKSWGNVEIKLDF